MSSPGLGCGILDRRNLPPEKAEGVMCRNGRMVDVRLEEAVEHYIKAKYARFHTPGHKGRLPIDPLADVTELPQTACLFDEEGPIRESERRLAQFMGVEDAFFSAGGATLGIQTMVRLCGAKTIIVGRGAHRSVYNAMALLGIEEISLYPGDGDAGIPGRYRPEDARKLFLEHPEAKALYVTSPDYYGCMSDIKGLRAVCDEFGAQLLVDNAHGSHLKFCGPGLHPMELGAHWCVDSWHKTLPVLTGGAVLYTSLPGMCGAVKETMGLFGSTSPNFMVLLSLDRCVDYLMQRGTSDFTRLVETADELRKAARVAGFITPRGLTDPVRLTVGTGKGSAVLTSYFKAQGIAPEAVLGGWAIFLLSPMNTTRDLNRLSSALEKWFYPQSLPETEELIRPRRAVPMDVALRCRWEEVPVEQAQGRICYQVTSACPPGIPVLLPGEYICYSCVKFLKKCGISSVKVIQYS